MISVFVARGCIRPVSSGKILLRKLPCLSYNIIRTENLIKAAAADDNEETFKVRYNSYIENTKPLLDYYKDKGLLVNIDKISNPEETFTEIEKVIK